MHVVCPCTTGCHPPIFAPSASRKLTKSLLFTLSLTSEFGTAVTETSNVVLHVSNFVLLPLDLFHLVLLQLCSCANVRVIVSSIILELPFVNINDVSTDTAEKILRVRDED